MAFSDGVFAVAITLLVFTVPVPTIAQNDALSRLPAALLQTAPPLLTFALSFFLVGFYWIRHHQLFRQIVSADVWLLWLNLVVLFLVCLLPFSSGVVGRYHYTVIGAEVYALNLALIAIAFSALYMYASRAQQVRPLPPGMGTGFFSQGLLLPIVVVALVMVLAPLNLVAAYVIGVGAAGDCQHLHRGSSADGQLGATPWQGHINLHLCPSGTVPIRIRGGASEVSVRRPSGVPVRVIPHGGFRRLQVDGKSIEATDEKPIQSLDYVAAVDCYDLELADGADRFLLGAEPT